MRTDRDRKGTDVPLLSDCVLKHRGNQKHKHKGKEEKHMKKLLEKLMQKSVKSTELETDAEYRDFMYAQGFAI